MIYYFSLGITQPLKTKLFGTESQLVEEEKLANVVVAKLFFIAVQKIEGKNVFINILATTFSQKREKLQKKITKLNLSNKN